MLGGRHCVGRWAGHTQAQARAHAYTHLQLHDAVDVQQHAAELRVLRVGVQRADLGARDRGVELCLDVLCWVGVGVFFLCAERGAVSARASLLVACAPPSARAGIATAAQQRAKKERTSRPVTGAGLGSSAAAGSSVNENWLSSLKKR